MEEKEILDRLKAILSEVLEVDDSEIREDSSLFNDLGVESIDLLDLTFSIEEAFNIEIRSGELWNVGIDFMDDERYLVDGLLTREGILELHRRFPLVEITKLADRVEVRDVFGLITVRMITHYVSTKLREEPT